ncbi:hypothetical protein C1D09_003905 [Mesorhizobium intechi]|uniref:Uncharacterized protein n=1 Tax=Mesorhizobium intechi TaxID=537601 RepID=A0A8T9AVI9_9HYPH|nr:hypothetical protein [Mesorhizobium intechi]TSE13467.1 hypothetical protein C1D09_003905 [Mesorhizobium intechi]
MAEKPTNLFPTAARSVTELIAPPGAWFGPVMAMADSSRDRKRRHDALRREGGAMLLIKVRNLAALADWLIENSRLQAWDDGNRAAITRAIEELLDATVTRSRADQIECDSCSETEEIRSDDVYEADRRR